MSWTDVGDAAHRQKVCEDYDAGRGRKDERGRADNHHISFQDFKPRLEGFNLKSNYTLWFHGSFGQLLMQSVQTFGIARTDLPGDSQYTTASCT
eukprot:1433232-Rhodomonas_salina.1